MNDKTNLKLISNRNGVEIHRSVLPYRMLVNHIMRRNIQFSIIVWLARVGILLMRKVIQQNET